MAPAELAAKWRCYTGPEDVVELEADARAVRLAALREAARAVCDYCRCGTPLVWLSGHAMHEIIGSMAPPCRAEGIHRLIEKEAANEPR